MSARTWKTLQAEAAGQLERGEVGRAAHTLIEAIELAPDEPRLYEQLIRVALLAGGTQTAVNAALELRRLGPHKPEYAYLHAVASMAHGDIDGAEAVLEQARRGAPDAPEVLQALAQVYRLKRRDEAALALLAQAVERLPTAPALVNDYAVLLLERDRPREARAALERLPAGAAGTALNLALACAKLGDVDAARRHAGAAQASDDAELRAQAERLLATLSPH